MKLFLIFLNSATLSFNITAFLKHGNDLNLLGAVIAAIGLYFALGIKE